MTEEWNFCCRLVLSRHPAGLRLRGPKRFSMKIRAGYEISYDCPQPTPMILQLSVHPSRIPDLLTWDRHADRSAHPRQHLSRQFRQFLPRDPRPRGPADHVHRLPGAGQGRAGRDSPAGGAACTGRSAGGGPDLSARQPLLRDRSPIEYCVVPVRAASERLAAGARRSATTSTIASRSATSTRARPRRRSTPIPSSAACAGTSPISRSRCAAA